MAVGRRHVLRPHVPKSRIAARRLEERRKSVEVRSRGVWRSSAGGKGRKGWIGAYPARTNERSVARFRSSSRSTSIRLGDRGKPWVSTARGNRAARNYATKRIVEVEMADAAAQIAARVECDERRTAPAVYAVKIRRGSARACHMRGDGVARETEEKQAIGIRSHQSNKCNHEHNSSQRTQRARRKVP
jgi:hypothetical protein